MLQMRLCLALVRPAPISATLLFLLAMTKGSHTTIHNPFCDVNDGDCDLACICGLHSQ